MRRIVTIGPALVVVMATVAALLLAPRIVRDLSAAQTAGEVRLIRQALGEDDILERLNNAVRNVARVAEPSVVHVDVAALDDEDSGPSSGSGWVFDDSGHIVTNAHVIRGAERIRVQFHDGRTEIATKIGVDPFTDIAVLKVGATDGLIPFRRATGERLSVGERVFAFGSPFGFKFSMSEGIVSGLGRTARAGARFGGYSNFIQTDAAVNPGNSGGPLVDVKGRLVGMNVAIATARESEGTVEGQSAGISFAIPLSTIESVAEQLISSGTVRRGFMGISYGGPDQRRRRELGFNGFGVVVNGVSDDSPAAQAGLAAGDIITHLDDQRVIGPDVLRSVIAAKRPGETLAVRAYSATGTKELTVALAEQPAAVVRQAEFVRLDETLGVFWRSGGNTVAWVRPETPMARAGVEVGMRVVGVNDRETGDATGVLNALLDEGFMDGKLVRLKVTTGDAEPGSEPRIIELRLR